MGSMVEKIVPHSPVANKSSVTTATMQMVDSARTADSAASREAMLGQSIIWAVFMASREAILSPVKFRLTLLSPTTEMRRDIVKPEKTFCEKTWVRDRKQHTCRLKTNKHFY